MRLARIAATTLLAGLVVAVGFALVVRGGPAASAPGPSEPSAVAHPSASASALATPVAVDETPVPASPTAVPTPHPVLAWDRVDAIESGAWVGSVVWLGDRWLAVGSLEGRAAAWTSTDGRAWVASDAIGPAPTNVRSPEQSVYRITAAASADGGLLAFGWNAVGCCDAGRPMLWRADDDAGTAWSEVNIAATAWGTAYFVPRTVAVNAAGEFVLLTGENLGGTPVIWISADGSAWTRHDLAAGGGLQMLNDIAASDDGVLGVGAVVTANETPQVWTSADGREWAPGDGPPTARRLNAVAWDEVGGRYVVAGVNVDGLASAWLGDAGEWAEVVLDGDPSEATAVAAADGTIVLAGTVDGLGTPGVTAWSSRDGEAWSSEELGIATPFPVLAVNGGGAVLHAVLDPAPGSGTVVATFVGEPLR